LVQGRGGIAWEGAGQASTVIPAAGQGGVIWGGAGAASSEYVLAGTGGIVWGGTADAIIGNFPDSFCIELSIGVASLDIELTPHTSQIFVEAARLTTVKLQC